MGGRMNWPNLKFPPINLWNVPYMWKEKTILDKILDEEFRYYIKFNKCARVVYIGNKQWEEVKRELCYDDDYEYINNLDIIRVTREDYLRVS